MADAKTGADALGWYLTGAIDRGGVQRLESFSLGGKRASTELQPLGFIPTGDDVPPIRIDWIAGANGRGDAELQAADASDIQFQTPGGTGGTAVTIANGETKLLTTSGDTDKAIRVSRTSTDNLGAGNTMPIRLTIPRNTALSMGNVTNADRSAGADYYRGLILRAHGSNNITLLKVWLRTLGTQQTTDNAQLGATGTGTIGTTGSFADWPESGWARIETSGGTEREIVYYTSRTDSVLTVSAAGHRARLGTSAGAGANDDVVDAVPGARIGKESPDGNGDIQTIADENTAPTSVTWNTGITAANGLDIGSVNSGVNHGLWIHREIPAGAKGVKDAEIALNFSFTESAAQTGEIHGLYLVEDTSLTQFELYVGEDADPDLTAAPDDTNATLANLSASVTPPGAGSTKEIRFTVIERNKYNLTSLNTYFHTSVIDSNGDEVTADPSDPTSVSLDDVGSGLVVLTATYSGSKDASVADTWAYRIKTDGTTPTSGDTATETAMTAEQFFFSSQRKLRAVLGPYLDSTALVAAVSAKRSSDSVESALVTDSLTVGTERPKHAEDRLVGFGLHDHSRLFATSFSDVDVDTGNNIRFVVDRRRAFFYADTTLIWAVVDYDSTVSPNPSTHLYVNNVFDINVVDGVGAGGNSEAIETISFTAMDKRLGVNVNGTRRMLIDITNGEIRCAAINVVDGVSNTVANTAFDAYTNGVLFAVIDPDRETWAPYSVIDDTGEWRIDMNIDATKTQAQIEAL